jgi:ABC-type branched-subunit amino acid transport system substrate-binding protein
MFQMGSLRGAASRAKHIAALAMALLLPFASHAEVGVSDTEIKVGQSAVFSGPSARLGREMRDGIDAAFFEANRQGGIEGRRLTLISLDDGYEPDRAASNTATLINDKKVFALLGYVGTPTSNAALPVFTAAHVPFVGAFTGAATLRAFNRYVFNVRASYMDEGQPIMQVLSQYGRVALFIQDDGYGAAVKSSFMHAMDELGMRPATIAVVKRNSLDVSEAADQLCKSGATAVAMGTVYGAAGELQKALHARGCFPVLASVSFIGTSALIDELRDNAVGIGISQVMPSPFAESYRVVREYHDAMRAAGHDRYTYGSIEGYVAARVFIEGLRRSGHDLTRDRFIASLEGLGRYDLGGFAVTFTPKSHNGSNWVDMTVVSSDLTLLR